MRVDRNRKPRNSTIEKQWRKEKLVPHGTSTMSDDDFWGRVHEFSAAQDATAMSTKSGTRQGRYAYANSRNRSWT